MIKVRRSANLDRWFLSIDDARVTCGIHFGKQAGEVRAVFFDAGLGGLGGKERLKFRFFADSLFQRTYAEVSKCSYSGQNGGEGGIRTRGTLLRFTSLAKKRFRPLSHFSFYRYL